MTQAEFRTKLLLVMLAALVWRVAYVLVTKRHAAVWGDAFAYHYGANLLATGKGFVDPVRYSFSGLRFPSAAHPPLYMSYLAAWSLVGLKSALWHRLVSCALGVATVGLVGLLGRRLAGERAGLIAALLAAAYPHLWLNDAALMSETAAAFAVVLAMLTVERYREQPTMTRTWQLGGALALAVMGRAELAILVPAIALPLVLTTGGIELADRWKRVGAVAVASLVLIGPWVGYNLTRFEHPVLLSNGFGATLQGGSCDATFYGTDIGYWAYCPGANDVARIPPPPASTLARWDRDRNSPRTKAEQRAYFRRYFTGAPDESENDVIARRDALRYIRANEGQIPLVVAARIGRVWNVFRPWQNARLDGFVEGRGLAQARRRAARVLPVRGGGDRRARRPAPPPVSDLAVPRAGGGRDVHGRDLVRDPALPDTGRRRAPRARGGGDRRAPAPPIGDRRDRGAQLPQRTAEYDMSFVHLCVAPTMRIVPDFERITRLCVLAPSPQ